MRFEQISDHKRDIYLYGKLSAKLVAQAANKNTKSSRSQWFVKLGVLENFPMFTRKQLHWSLFLV